MFHCLQREMTESVQTLADLTTDESALADVDAFIMKQEVIILVFIIVIVIMMTTIMMVALTLCCCLSFRRSVEIVDICNYIEVYSCI